MSLLDPHDVLTEIRYKDGTTAATRGWDGDSETLECPNGHVIEWDGRCPSEDRDTYCGTSPLRLAGLI